MLTVDMVAGAVPPSMKNLVTQSLVDRLNNLDEEPDIADGIRENFISYTSVLMDGKFKVEDYLSAVKFVSFLLMKMTKKDAWARTFPDRHRSLLAKGASSKTISAHVAMYAGTKLVNLVLEQSLVPIWVLNQHMRQRALEVQYRLMTGAHSEMVQTQAANSLLQHLTPPKEVKAAQVNINIGGTKAIASLEAAMHELVEKQKKLIKEGTLSARTIASSSIVVDAEVEPA